LLKVCLNCKLDKNVNLIHAIDRYRVAFAPPGVYQWVGN
jgi:hypothetical protein